MKQQNAAAHQNDAGMITISGLRNGNQALSRCKMKSVVIVDPGALVVARTCANPRGEVPLGRKSRCSGTYFGNNLLRRILSQTGPVIDLASAAPSTLRPSGSAGLRFGKANDQTRTCR